jgi:hypothetical protein
MAEAKVGDEFITHEFDEAIAIQRAIVDAEQALPKSHPHAGSKAAIKDCIATAERGTAAAASGGDEESRGGPGNGRTAGGPGATRA